jgi:hypothetical protein
MSEALLNQTNFSLRREPTHFTNVSADQDICTVLHELTHFLAGACVALLIICNEKITLDMYAFLSK